MPALADRPADTSVVGDPRCPGCGSLRNLCITGAWHCPRCQHYTAPPKATSQPRAAKVEPSHAPCPRCGTVKAVTVPACPSCGLDPAKLDRSLVSYGEATNPQTPMLRLHEYCPTCQVRRDLIGGRCVCPVCHDAQVPPPTAFAPPATPIQPRRRR